MTRLHMALIGAVLALAVAGGLWLHGRSAGQGAAEAAQDREYRQTIERARDADLSTGNPDSDAEWLHKRGGR